MWYLATSLYTMSRLNLFLKFSESLCISYRSATSPEMDRRVLSIQMKRFHLKWKNYQLCMKTSTVGNSSSRMNEKMCALLLKRYCFSREEKKTTEEKHRIIIAFCIHCISYFPKKAYQLKWWILTFTDSSREHSIYILQALCYLFTILMQNYCFCNIYKDLVTSFQGHISHFFPNLNPVV